MDALFCNAEFIYQSMYNTIPVMGEVHEQNLKMFLY